MSASSTVEVPDRSAQQARFAVRTEAVLALVVVVIALLAVAVLAGSRLAGPDHPADTSPEAGFARDMQTHHNQAVEMALMIRDKTSDPVLRAVSYDIIVSQQQQSGQMYGWLAEWGLPQTSSEPAMTWMSTRSGVNPGGHDMSSMAPGATMAPGEDMTSGSMLLPDGRMPGMASAADLAALQAASGRDAEMRFLTLMIAHHQAGIAMARAVLPLTDRPEVRALAEAIVTAQTAEIEQMTTLLQARQN